MLLLQTQRLAKANTKCRVIVLQSNGRPESCLGLIEWQTLLADAGFTVTHAECLDKEIEFGTWVQRMRSSEATTARLTEMLRDEPLRSFLKPRETASGPDFTLTEGIILGRKPR